MMRRTAIRFVRAQARNERPVISASPLPSVDPAKHSLWFLAILSLLMGFGSISTDLYLPAMPAMKLALHAKPGAIELTISGYLMGFSLGQLAWGPISDRYGRRIPIALGLMLFVLGSAGCALSTSASLLIGCRIVQALGACASVVLARAMVRDLYSGSRAASMLSTLMMVMAIAPLLGPIVGGQILLIGSWRAIFWVLVGIGLATLAALFTLPETLPQSKRIREPLARAMASYFSFLGNRRLVAYVGTGGFFYGGLFAYVAGSPFAYITFHHLSPQLYAVTFAVGAGGIMATNLVNARLVRRLSSDRLLRMGTGAAAIAAIAVAIGAYGGYGGFIGLALPVFLFTSMTGFIVANSIVGALADFSQRAGAVSALIGATQYGSGVAGSALVGAFADGTPWSMGWVIALAGVGSALSASLLRNPQLEFLQ